jgi:uncharacterized Zn finger protein (UPF0148 family)
MNNSKEMIVNLEERLTNLMQIGWTLIAESCPLDKCRCPLLKSLDGNKYCVNCETWIFDKEPKKEKFTELVKKGTQNLTLKDMELTQYKKQDKGFMNGLFKDNVINSLKMKLGYLANSLNETNDLNKTQSILTNISLCVENIKLICQIF